MNESYQTKLTRDKIDNINKSIHELRTEDSYMQQKIIEFEANKAEMLAMIDNRTHRITARDFAYNFLMRIISPDPIIRREGYDDLSRYAGGDYHPLYIVDDNDHEHVLLNIRNIKPSPVNTSAKGHDSLIQSEVRKISQDQLGELPLYAQSRQREFGELLTEESGVKDATEEYFHGWYEVLRFYGALIGDEKEAYQKHLIPKQQAHGYIYWTGSMDLEEYIQKHGYQTYGLPLLDVQVSEEEKKTLIAQEQQQANNPTAVLEDVDDWE